MRLAVGVRSGVHWHDHRASASGRAGDARAVASQGNDAAALRPAGRRRVGRAGHRANDSPFQRPGSRAAGAVRHPDPSRHHPRRPRRIGVDRAQPIGIGPFRFAGWERAAHPPERRRTTGAAPASTRSSRFDRRRRALNRRGAGISTCGRACSTCTTRSRSSRRRCTGARRSTGPVPALFVSCRTAHTHCPDAPSARSRCLGPPALRRRAAHDLAAADQWPPIGDDVPTPFDRARAIALLEEAGYATVMPTACATRRQGDPSDHARAGGHAVQRRGAGVRADAQAAARRSDIDRTLPRSSRLKRGEFDSRR